MSFRCERERHAIGGTRGGPRAVLRGLAVLCRRTGLLAVLLAPLGDVPPAIAQAAGGGERVTLYVGEVPHRFTAEIADDPIERARGLMFRKEMASDHGMLFDFAAERPVSFWMKNTPLSLDMIFVEADGDIIAIAEHVTPFSEASVSSGGPVRFVFEVLAGTADRLGLAPGDRLEHRRVVHP